LRIAGLMSATQNTKAIVERVPEEARNGVRRRIEMNAVIRNYTLILSMVVGLVSTTNCFADMSKLEQDANKEGEVTWYVSQHTAEDAERFARKFSEIYPAIKVNVVRSTAAVAYQRVTQDIKSGNIQADVFSTTNIIHYIDLRDKGYLDKYSAENAKYISPLFKSAIDKDGYFYPTSAGVLYIAYNTNLVKPEEAPHAWKDLLDPKWHGKLASGHPGFSGQVAMWATMVTKLYGPSYIDDLAKNEPLVGRSIYDTVTQLNSGERAVAVAAAENAWIDRDKGNPIGIVYPEEGTLLAPEPTAILKGSPHPNAARLFMEFALSKEYGDIVADLWRVPVRGDVELKPGLMTLDKLKVVPLSQDEMVNQMPEVISHWRDVFGG
jgi:iron(III) transport system substrate-binding protein